LASAAIPSRTGRLKARLLPEAVPLVTIRFEEAAVSSAARWCE
jgi:hypothetical protein